MSTRNELAIIEQWIKPKSRVLDLGCGDGTLLNLLAENSAVEGYGLEIDPHEIAACINRGVNVIEADIDQGLSRFTDNSFDTVVMTQALQVMRQPHTVVDEMLRIGTECVVTFPNFGNWHTRLFLGLHGRMPVTRQLTYQWYDTPNIHFCTVRDFENLCKDKNIHIIHREFVSERIPNKQIQGIWPNLFSETAIYHLSK